MTWSARIEHTPTADVQVERIGEKNGHPCFIIVIDGQVHFAWRDADEPDDLQGCLNGDHDGQANNNR